MCKQTGVEDTHKNSEERSCQLVQPRNVISVLLCFISIFALLSLLVLPISLLSPPSPHSPPPPFLSFLVSCITSGSLLVYEEQFFFQLIFRVSSCCFCSVPK